LKTHHRVVIPSEVEESRSKTSRDSTGSFDFAPPAQDDTFVSLGAHKKAGRE